MVVYSVFSVFGLKVGIHPVISNQPQRNGWERRWDLMRLGGMSATLMTATLSDDRGDPIELYIDELKRDAYAEKRTKEDGDRYSKEV